MTGGGTCAAAGEDVGGGGAASLVCATCAAAGGNAGGGWRLLDLLNCGWRGKRKKKGAQTAVPPISAAAPARLCKQTRQARVRRE